MRRGKKKNNSGAIKCNEVDFSQSQQVFFLILILKFSFFLEFIAGASFIYLFIPVVAFECKLSLQVLIHHLDVCWICGTDTVPIFFSEKGEKKKTKKGGK